MTPLTPFRLDARLEADTLEVAALPLCLVRLMNDRRFPWVILVPARPNMVEIDDLAPPDRAVLIEEIVHVTAAMRDLFRPIKLNVGALGNIVRQLHVHVVARFASDAAWPGPVWGTTAERYRADELEPAVTRLRDRLGDRA